MSAILPFGLRQGSDADHCLPIAGAPSMAGHVQPEREKRAYRHARTGCARSRRSSWAKPSTHAGRSGLPHRVAEPRSDSLRAVDQLSWVDQVTWVDQVMWHGPTMCHGPMTWCAPVTSYGRESSIDPVLSRGQMIEAGPMQRKTRTTASPPAGYEAYPTTSEARLMRYES
jgi:hypothetical protein